MHLDLRVQRSVVVNLSRRPLTAEAGPFVLGLDPGSRDLGVNYATPRPGVAITAADVRALITTFRSHDRVPRLEYVTAAAPGLESLLADAGFTVEARHDYLICAPGSLVAPPRPADPLRVLTGSAVTAGSVASSRSAMASGSTEAAGSGMAPGSVAALGSVPPADPVPPTDPVPPINSVPPTGSGPQTGRVAAGGVGASGFDVREPRDDADRAALVAAQNEAFGGDPVATAAHTARLARVQAQGGVVLMAVAADGTCAGGGLAVAPHDGVSEVAGIAVRPAFWRRGLAAAITAGITARLHAAGADVPWLEASGADSSRVYERIGYRPAGQRLYLTLTG
ncbi:MULTISPECIES: GNAT family N-acetyltransferase [Catenuloplanes]|uniref:GNAT superfamily N-acetyltransferase n=1 Tax=Catenuloplanes niger TaxID=587534 RepID=A0AAE3ZXS5_9ACTN|nr:GNAT family N-acetyltransferase [Catenuloplanes niger]MDR7327877.1 GNAT superfamily N-acetyltransferase [Catenuloplanes niger]